MSQINEYLHDRLILLLLSINTFLAFAGSLFILLQLGSRAGNGYIVQCRDCSNIGDINRFTNGSVVDLLAFIGFALLILVLHTLLSMRTYHIHRQVAVTILGLGTLLLVLDIIISNALLVLR